MTDKTYRQEDTEYVYNRIEEIKDYAATMGVSATAVAAAIIKENNAYNASPYLNKALDNFAQLNLGSNTAVRDSIAAWKGSYWNANDAKPGIVQKADYPVLIDMGIANIKLTTAVQLLDDYFVKYPNDPLNLSGYKNNAQNVVTDLNNSMGNELTAKLSTLMIREAQDFYTLPQTNAEGQALNISAGDWAALSQEERDGLMVMYFTRGEESMSLARDVNVAKNGFFNPLLGDGESGGLWTLDNAALIGKTMQVPGYGDTASRTLGLDLDPPADDTVSASLGANTPTPIAPAASTLLPATVSASSPPPAATRTVSPSNPTARSPIFGSPRRTPPTASKTPTNSMPPSSPAIRRSPMSIRSRPARRSTCRRNSPMVRSPTIWPTVPASTTMPPPANARWFCRAPRAVLSSSSAPLTPRPATHAAAMSNRMRERAP